MIWDQLEKNKKTQIKRLGEKIDKNEQKLNEIRKEMEKEENVTSYTKLAELQEKIDELEKENESSMIEWEELNTKLYQLLKKQSLNAKI